MLNGKNIHAKDRCKELGDEMDRPFKVLSSGKNGLYSTLRLPELWKIHLTFNVELLERYQGTNQKTEVIEIEGNDTGWRMESLIASSHSDNDSKNHVYVNKWEEYLADERTWEIYENVFKCSLDLLNDY